MTETKIPYRVNITAEIISAPFYQGGDIKTESLDTLEETVEAITKKILERSSFVAKERIEISIKRKTFLTLGLNIWKYKWIDIETRIEVVEGGFEIKVEMPNV
jgi:hypothetical protein